ncbi:MAG: HEPN domain-containing protein [Methanoregula sp.]|nr:HEPN domain-containing protein [Methanoregula sp.]MCX6697997.1 HEPN domain-containing protein [Methanoregula sp.]
MSDLDEARAIRYFLDAFYDRDTIKPAREAGLYPVVIFHSQQVCEKSAKGCLSLYAIIIASDHHASDFFNRYIIPESGNLQSQFQKNLVHMNRLESYYIPSRYGVNKSGRVHYLEYNLNTVTELSQAAVDFLEISMQFFEIKTGKMLPRSRERLEQYFLKAYSHCIRMLE